MVGVASQLADGIGIVLEVGDPGPFASKALEIVRTGDDHSSRGFEHSQFRPVDEEDRLHVHVRRLGDALQGCRGVALLGDEFGGGLGDASTGLGLSRPTRRRIDEQRHGDRLATITRVVI